MTGYSEQTARVGIVIPTLEALGGAERMAMRLAEGLVARGWQVTMVMLSGTGDAALAAWSRSSGVGVVSLGMRKAWIDPRGWRRFRAWQREFAPQILHGHLAHGAWFCRMTRVLGVGGLGMGGSRLGIVDTLHSTRVGGRWRRRLYRATAWATDCVTAVSDAVRVAAMEAGLHAGEIRVVRNGVDALLDTQVDALPEAGRQEHAGFRWLAMGRLEPVKAYPRLLRAFAQVVAGGTGAVELHVLGEGSERAKLETMAAALGVAERVHWHGFQPQPERMLAHCDAVVLASQWEGLPLCLLEAGAAGVPAVATATAGAREVLTDGETGWLVPLDDADGDGLAEVMLRLMAGNTAARAAMGERARRRVLGEFGSERMVAGYAAIYAEICGRRSRRA